MTRLLSQTCQPQDITGDGGSGGDWEVGVGRKSKVTLAACVIEQMGLLQSQIMGRRIVVVFIFF